MFRSDRQMKFSFLDSARSEAASVTGERDFTVVEECDLTELCQSILENLGLGDLAGRVVVEWNRRMRSTAGRATWPAGLIELNPHLSKISREEIRRTLLHELAHLVAYERSCGRRIAAHGSEWQKACVDVGIPGEKATHQLSLPSRTIKRKWRYECPSCRSAFERVRRYKGRVACYECCRDRNDGEYHERFRLLEENLLLDQAVSRSA